jgi:MEMO1 family protein
MIREAVFAGQFYPENRRAIIKQLDSFSEKKGPKKDILAKGLVLPHAGYVYSGRVALETILSFEISRTIIIIGPNHTGSGKDFSLSGASGWQTPLGEVKIDKGLSSKILDSSKYIEKDDQAHQFEHSIEVQLPLLQYAKKDFKIVPIIISSFDLGAYREIGIELAGVIKSSKQDVTVIASSDLTHYESQSEAESKDRKAIEAITALDTEGLMETKERLEISMCGFAPCAIMIEAVKNLGARQGKLIRYQTSGEATGDYQAVVGYAGLGIY